MSVEAPLVDTNVDAVDLARESESVRRTVTVIARLLGAARVLSPHDLPSFVTFHLGLPVSEVSVITHELRGLSWPLVRVEIARLLTATSSAVLRDDYGTDPPGYGLIDVDVDERVAAPDDLAGFVPAGELFAFDVVIVITQSRLARTLSLHVPRVHADDARRHLAELVDRARGEHNFLRGRTLRARACGDDIELIPVDPLDASREDVVHPAAVWHEIDTNIGGLTRHNGALLAAGLGASRGVLLAGPPGVGKTALCRVIATELPPGTTVVLVDANVAAHSLSVLYDAVTELAPAAVFLDDIDLFAGNRQRGTGGPGLGEFLTRLDGFRPSAPVITVATTNVTADLDPALIRPGRFDAVVEIGVPDAGGRSRILRHYLAAIADIDVAPLLPVTQGMSGADLREIVRRAVLERGHEVRVEHLLDVATTGRWKPAAPVGQYL